MSAKERPRIAVYLLLRALGPPYPNHLFNVPPVPAPITPGLCQQPGGGGGARWRPHGGPMAAGGAAGGAHGSGARPAQGAAHRRHGAGVGGGGGAAGAADQVGEAPGGAQVVRGKVRGSNTDCLVVRLSGGWGVGGGWWAGVEGGGCKRGSGWFLWSAQWASAVRALLCALPRQPCVMRSVAGCLANI